MNKSVAYYILTLFFLFHFSAVFAQTNAKLGTSFKENWFIGASAGPTFFSGDLNEKRFLPYKGDLTGGGSIYAGRQMNQIFSLRMQLFIGGLAGTKLNFADNSPANLHFTSTIFDVNVNTMVNLSNLISGYHEKRHFFVYGTVGIGITNWKTIKSSTIPDEVSEEQTSLSRSTAVIPFGLGAYYSIANKVNIGLEWTYRLATSDFVDDFKGGFAVDIYDYLGVSITYNFNKPSKHAPDVLDYKKEEQGPIVLNLPKCDPATLPKPQQSDAQSLMLPPPPSLSKSPMDLEYKVQIFAFSQRIYSPQTIRQRYHIPMAVNREYSNGLYRYTVGSTRNLEEARQLKARMISIGISDAFIAAYHQGERVPYTEPPSY